MAVSGKRREFVGYSPKIGFFQAEVASINPTLEQMNEFMDISNAKEPDYNKDFEDSFNDNATYKQATVTIYLKMHDGTIQPKRFSIVDKIRYSKEGNMQYINNLGNTTWAVPEDVEETDKKKHITNEKYAWFTKRDFRPALMGEEKLYNFLQKWLSLDWKDPDTTLSIDTDKLFKGNYKELQVLLKEPQFAEAKVVGYATIHMKIEAPSQENANPDAKYYQNIWDEFLPGNSWRYLHIEAAPGGDSYNIPIWKMTLPSWIQDYVNTMKGEYGSKDYLGKTVDNVLQIEELRDFDSKESPIAKASSIHNTTTSNVEQPETIDDLPF